MVAKITSGAAIYGVLYHNQEKVEKGKARTLAWNRVMETPDGKVGVAGCMRSFEPYLVANRWTEKPVIHLSLNPHPGDVLSDEQLETVGRECTDRLGYGDQPYVIFRYDDNVCAHTHIVSLRIGERGRKLRDYKEWERSTDICRELERKYGLLQSRGEEYRISRPMTAVDCMKDELKHQTAGVVKPTVQNYRFQSFKEFRALLGLFNVTVEEVHKTVDGKCCDGLVYAATSGKGECIGVGIRSSDIGKSVGYRVLQEKFSQSRVWMKKHPLPEKTREDIRMALRWDTREGFLHKLADKDTVSVLWESGVGVIYGVTYIDHNTRAVFKGSALGKEFSASAINRKYGMPPSVSDRLVSGQEPPVNTDTRETGSVEGLLDLFSMESCPYPSENIPRNIYGKKKKRRGRKGPRIN